MTGAPARPLRRVGGGCRNWSPEPRLVRGCLSFRVFSCAKEKVMGELKGLQDYLDRHYRQTVFAQAQASGEPWEFHLHGGRLHRAVVKEDLKYDLRLSPQVDGEETTPKLQVKLLYPESISPKAVPLINIDPEIHGRGLEPILSPKLRNHIKNKSLYPLMMEREVVFFTLLEGEIIRGVISGFTRYEIQVHMKGGVPVTLLRHAVLDLRNKKGRCFLKSFQEDRRDWEKSTLWDASPSTAGTSPPAKPS